MSGIEIAGLVLTAFTSVIKHYREGLARFKTLINYKEELERWIRSLELQQVLFRNTLGHLISSCAKYGPTVNQLLTNEDSYEWEKKWQKASTELGPDFQDVLFDSYELFKRTGNELKSTLNNLKSFLDDPQNGISAWFHRVRVSFSEHRPKLFEDLERENNELSKIVMDAVELKRYRWGGNAAPVYKEIRANAINLYEAIERSCIECQTKHQGDPHLAYIRLEARLADLTSFPSIDNERPSEKGVHVFRVILQKSASEPPFSVEVFRRNTNEDADSISSAATNDSDVGNAGPAQARNMSPRVTFQNAQPVAPAPNHPSPDESNSFKAFCPLLDIMNTLNEKPAEYLLGYLLDWSDCPHGFYSPRSNDFDMQSPKMMQLSQLYQCHGLDAVPAPDNQSKVLGRRARIRLALKLALAVLQLHGSQWLPERLSSEEVHLLCCDEPEQLQPLYCATFTSSSNHHATGDSIYQLVKILIELLNVQRFEDIDPPGTASGNTQPMEEMEKLRRLSSKTNVWHLGPQYKEALDNCLDFCKRQKSERDLNEDKITQDFHNDVLVHLIQVYRRHCSPHSRKGKKERKNGQEEVIVNAVQGPNLKKVTTPDSANAVAALSGAMTVAAPAKEAMENKITPLEGYLRYKNLSCLKSFTYKRKFFWFEFDAVDAKNPVPYSKTEKATNGVHQHAAKTGESLLLSYAETQNQKSAPQGRIQLADASKPFLGKSKKFYFTSKGRKHAFKASSIAERDNWVAQLNVKISEANDMVTTK